MAATDNADPVTAIAGVGLAAGLYSDTDGSSGTPAWTLAYASVRSASQPFVTGRDQGLLAVAFHFADVGRIGPRQIEGARHAPNVQIALWEGKLDAFVIQALINLGMQFMQGFQTNFQTCQKGADGDIERAFAEFFKGHRKRRILQDV